MMDKRDFAFDKMNYLLLVVGMIIVVIGFLLILYVMLSGAKRLEKRQNKNYGDDPEYQAYYKKTPAIFPFVPLYSLEKINWIK